MTDQEADAHANGIRLSVAMDRILLRKLGKSPQ